MSNYHHFTSLHSLHSPFLLPLTTILSRSPSVCYILALMGQVSGRLAFVGRRHCQLQFGIQIPERVLENRYSVPIPWQKPYNNRRIKETDSSSTKDMTKQPRTSRLSGNCSRLPASGTSRDGKDQARTSGPSLLASSLPQEQAVVARK